MFPSTFRALASRSTTNATSHLLRAHLPNRRFSSAAVASDKPTAQSSSPTASGQNNESNTQDGDASKRKKTTAEADEELRQKLEAMSGEGGEAGVELEGGKAVGMKRGVRENMFRYI